MTVTELKADIDIADVQLDKQKVVHSIAMIFVMISFVMLFATMFLGYTIYRSTTDVWPPFGFDKLPLAVPFLSTVLIAISSFYFILFERGLTKDYIVSKFYFTLSLLFGVGFCALQFVLWSDLQSLGIFAYTGTYGSLIYGFTWLHFAHMILGLVAMLFILKDLNKSPKLQVIKVINIGKFWHFLGLTWLAIFISIFVF